MSRNLSSSIDSLKHPLALLAAGIFPQAVLFIINLHSYSVIAGNMSADEKNSALLIFAAETILFLSVTAAAVISRVHKKVISIPAIWLLMGLCISFLWLISSTISWIIPSSIARWIMNPDSILLYQYLCIMPLVFHSVLLIASYDTRFSHKTEIIASAAGMLLPPLLGYLCVMVFTKMIDMPQKITGYLVTVFLIAGTIVMFLALTRLLLMAYEAVRITRKYLTTLLYILFGILMPLGGLVLNRYIPFPVDFQYVPVYVLVVCNGLSLAIPNMQNERINNIAAILRCVFFPFTLYFFIVFLPFLPLSIPAILVAGAGFLILTPSVLFVLHCRRIIGDFRHLRDNKNATAWKAAFIAAFLALPVFFSGRALLDRLSLNQAIAYIYEPSYRDDREFHGMRWFVKRGLENLRDQNSGAYLPFLTGYYNWITFDNLVLPEKKMREMYGAFFGSANMRNGTRDNSFMDEFADFAPENRLSVQENNFSPSTDVMITNIAQTSKMDNSFIRTRLRINMKNTGTSMNEFRAEMRIPEGVFVSGYWLRIGKETVPGKIFEKKTALWVYQNILNENRDPGVVYYVKKDTLRLRVFPFMYNEARIIEIELLYPRSMVTTVSINSKTIQLNSDRSTDQKILMSRWDGNSVIMVPGAVKKTLPKVYRVPYLHIIVDWSAKSLFTGEMVRNAVKTMLGQNPGIRYISIDCANYETRNITNGIIPVSALDDIDMNAVFDSTTRMGGFCIDRAMKMAAYRYAENTDKTINGHEPFLFYPKIMLIKNEESFVVYDEDRSIIHRWLPDVQGYYIWNSGAAERIYFDLPSIDKTRPFAGNPVIIMKINNRRVPISLYANELIHVKTGKEPVSFQVYDPGLQRFVSLSDFMELEPALPYARGMKGHALCMEKTTEPSRSSELSREAVSIARDSGILNQASSYIVVESAAQWNMLKLKEKQKLNNPEVLEFTSTPEPSIPMIMEIALLIMLRKKIHRVHAAQGSQ